MYIHIQLVPHRERNVSVTQASPLEPHKEITTIYSEKQRNIQVHYVDKMEKLHDQSRWYI